MRNGSDNAKAAALIVLALAGLPLAGCGASKAGEGAGTGHGTSAGASNPGGADGAGAANAKGARGAGAKGARGAGAKGAHGAGGLQVDTTPRYAKVPASAPTQSGTVKIAYRNYAIDPDTVKVKVGSTIKWTNYDPDVHNVVSEGGPLKFSSGNFGEGKSYTLTVTKPGIIHYECTLQPTTMNGTIEVVQ